MSKNKDIGKIKFKELARALCEAETGSQQINIAQMSEILGKISDLAYANPMVINCIIETGIKRRIKKWK